MEKRNIVLAAVAVVSLLIVAGFALAQGMRAEKSGPQSGMGMMNGMMQGMMQHHEEMEEVMEEGTYSDLVALKEKYDSNIIPWVESEEDFKLAQQMHEKMEKYHEENGEIGGHGCPMMKGMMS